MNTIIFKFIWNALYNNVTNNGWSDINKYKNLSMYLYLTEDSYFSLWAVASRQNCKLGGSIGLHEDMDYIECVNINFDVTNYFPKEEMIIDETYGSGDFGPDYNTSWSKVNKLIGNLPIDWELTFRKWFEGEYYISSHVESMMTLNAKKKFEKTLNDNEIVKDLLPKQ